MPRWPDLVVRRLFALKRLQRDGGAMDLAAAERGRCAEVPDCFFAVGDLLLDLAAGVLALRPKGARLGWVSGSFGCCSASRPAA
ncbi:MAG: hypothetical protein IH627_18470 [Rubrivivax sp.]|nr:hypothetical protein [Rubrivivax sp.]